MNRFLRVALMLSVASAVPALAQDAKKAEDKPAPAPNRTIMIQRVGGGAVTVKNVEVKDKPKDEKAKEVKKVEAVKGEAIDVQVVVQGQAVPAQAVVIENIIDVVAPMQLIRAAGRANANLDPLIAQFTPQLRPLLKTELHFVKLVCEPTKAQQKAIALEADKGFKEAVRKYADAQQKMMNGQWRGNTQPDARKMLQQAMVVAVKTSLTAEQAAKYQEELNRRAADLKTVTIRNIMVKLDQDLVLSADQREALSQALHKDWKDAWGSSLETYMYGNESLPALPDKLITPLLNPTQKKVWTSSQKNPSNTFFGNINFAGGFEMEGDPLDEEVFAELRKVEAAEAKARELSKGPPRLDPPDAPQVQGVEMLRLVQPR